MTRESFGIDNISDEEILKRLNTSVLIIPTLESKIIGYFSTDILNVENSEDNSIDKVDLFGVYNSASVIKKEYQNRGLYHQISCAFDSLILDFNSTRTQNIAIYNSFKRQFPQSIIDKTPTKEESSLGKSIAQYLDCKESFDNKTFICNNVYEGSRSNNDLVQGLEANDAYILLNKK